MSGKATFTVRSSEVRTMPRAAATKPSHLLDALGAVMRVLVGWSAVVSQELEFGSVAKFRVWHCC